MIRASTDCCSTFGLELCVSLPGAVAVEPRDCWKCKRGLGYRHPNFCTPAARFWKRVRAGKNGCWVWPTSPRQRYGCFPIGKGSVLAHRFGYEVAYGPIPDGMKVLHRCDNPPCVNPTHLFLGTQLVNARDKIAKGRERGPTAQNRLKTHCPKRHPYSGDNLYEWNGQRRCKTCDLNRTKERRQRGLR